MRRLLIAFYVLLCTGLLVLLLGAVYLALPTATEWTLDEARLSTLSHEELTNDYWQWGPLPDRELLAIGRTEYLTQKIVFPKLVGGTWGYYIYFRFRISDPNLRELLSAAAQSGSQGVWPYERQRADEPLPAWFHPKYSISLPRSAGEESFYFDPAEPDVAYTTHHYEGSPNSP